MIKKKSWDEFRNAKLLWWINRTLHLFGWAIVVETDESGKIVEVYPANVDLMGFSEEDEREGFSGLLDHLKKVLAADRSLSDETAATHIANNPNRHFTDEAASCHRSGESAIRDIANRSCRSLSNKSAA